MIQYIYDAEGARIAQGTLTSVQSSSTATCAPPVPNSTASGLTSSMGLSLTKRYLVDLSGAQVSEFSETSGETWQRSNIWSGGKLLATYDTKGLHFELTDPLGTKRVQANIAGQVDETCTSLPFGNDVNNPMNLWQTSCIPKANTVNTLQTQDDATEHHFTGKERDSESGNDYFEARYFGSSMGRFLSPDYSDSDPFPVPSADFDNPQSLNLYSYVHNNPLVNVDPDGHDCVVQTRTSSTTEQVTVSSGNCDNVKVNTDEGQTKTYVAGTVDMSSIKGNGSGGITFGYTSYGGDAGVASLGGASMPDHPGLAYGFGNNAQGYQTLGAAKTTVDYATAFVALTAGSVGAAIAGTEIAAGTAAARSQIIFRMAHGMRVALGHLQVLAEQSAVKNAIATAIASGTFQKVGNVISGVVNVAGTYIRFTGYQQPGGQTIISNVMGQALQR